MYVIDKDVIFFLSGNCHIGHCASVCGCHVDTGSSNCHIPDQQTSTLLGNYS